MLLRFLRLSVATSTAFFSILPIFSATGITQEYPSCFMVTSLGQVINLNDICPNKTRVSHGNQPKAAITATPSDTPLSSEPEGMSSLIEQGVDKHGAGDYEGAIENYTKVLQSNPNDALAYFSRAAARDELKDYQGAIKDLQQAVKLFSDQRDPVLYQQALIQLNRIKKLQQF